MSDRQPAEDDTLDPSAALDEDELGVDPLERGVEPPEHWSAAERVGTTPAEVREGESHAERLAEEQPDVQPEPVPDRPLAATPAEDLDESVETAPVDVEDVTPGDGPARRPVDSDPGERADEPDGTVADAIRSARNRRA
ncbi:hypothetical protein GCM10022222_80970 [Amycolatopsis ultiminotia]|uniref:DUF5709 domain-containing protein n=1 Tax=Amycolatopsis ultiminotia TaxID=543629 RepID=A0ABP6YJC4_9PSEU